MLTLQYLESSASTWRDSVGSINILVSVTELSWFLKAFEHFSAAAVY